MFMIKPGDKWILVIEAIINKIIDPRNGQGTILPGAGNRELNPQFSASFNFISFPNSIFGTNITLGWLSLSSIFRSSKSRNIWGDRLQFCRKGGIFVRIRQNKYRVVPDCEPLPIRIRNRRKLLRNDQAEYS